MSQVTRLTVSCGSDKSRPNPLGAAALLSGEVISPLLFGKAETVAGTLASTTQEKPLVENYEQRGQAVGASPAEFGKAGYLVVAADLVKGDTGSPTYRGLC